MSGIRVFIEGKPVAQDRPRVTVMGGKPRLYDPKECKAWKRDIAMITRSEMNRTRKRPFLRIVSLKVALVFHLEKPQSALKSRKHPIVKPDIDNLSKAILDGLNGIAYHDDSQIVELNVKKRYSKTAGVYVTIEAMEE
jgi:Holliday junction resolvase RusA-like endonuclease